MTELPYMPFYPADWLLDTQDLSPEGYRAYHKLLCNMWLNRANALPNDPAILRNRAGVSAQKWRFVWAEIEGYFDISAGGLVSHQKLIKLGVKARASYGARSRAGRKGGKAKWLKTKEPASSGANGKADGNAISNQNQTSNNTRGKASKYDFPKEAGPWAATLQAIRDGKAALVSQVTAAQARIFIAKKWVTEAQCKAAHVDF